MRMPGIARSRAGSRIRRRARPMRRVSGILSRTRIGSTPRRNFSMRSADSSAGPRYRRPNKRSSSQLSMLVLRFLATPRCEVASEGGFE